MDTRTKIIEIAFDSFLNDGFDRISLNEIIKRTELSKGTFYHHFKSKEALLEEITGKYLMEYITHGIDQFAEYQGSIEDKISLAIKTIASVQDRIKILTPPSTDTKAFILLLQEGMRRDENLRATYHEYQVKIITTLTRLFEEGQQIGRIRKDVAPKAIAELLNVTLKGSMFEATLMDDSVEDVMKQNVETLLAFVADNIGEAYD